MLRSRTMLGLAVSRRAITAVEVAAARGRSRLLRAAELPLTEQVGLRNPVELGKALKDLLRQRRFSSSRCVIGLEAAYLAAKEKRLPAAASGSLPDVLRIAAEQDFASDGQDLILDYASSTDAKGACALLVAAPRSVVDQAQAVARAAGLNVEAVTSSGVALAQATAPAAQPGGRLVLSVSPDGAELVGQQDGSPRLLRRLPFAPPAASDGGEPTPPRLGDLETQLRRVLAASPAEASSGPGALLVWNAAALDESSLQEMGRRLSLPTRICALPADLAGLDGTCPEGGDDRAAAAALAVAGASARPLALDFVHSRLAVRKQRRLGPMAVWGAAAAVIVIALAALLLWDWRSSQREISDLKDKLAGLDEPVRQARDVVDKASFARGWYDRRPKFLDCLREATLAFPQEGTIWATSLAVREDMHVVLSGKSVNKTAVLDLVDRLNSDRRLTDVKPLPIRDVGTTTTEVSFAISFSFAGTD